jgi:peptide deformylase
MAVRPVLAMPDPFLQRPSAKVGTADAEALLLADHLLDTMRAFAIDVTGHRRARSCSGELVLFDPELLSAAGPETAREGCLSIPDLTGDVARATKVVVRGIGVDGCERIVEADAFEVRALLHELDHLDGFVFLDRVTSAHAVYRRKVYR